MRLSVAFVSTVLIVTAVASAAGLTFKAPAEWRAKPLASSMRVADFDLPRAVGDAEDAELVVYYFGGEGGSVEANIERWTGQIRQPGGRSSSSAAVRQTRQINGLKVTLVDVTGTYTAEMAPGASQHFDKPDFRLRAAVVETPGGPYFVKLTGPAKTVASWDASFEAFISSLRYQ